METQPLKALSYSEILKKVESLIQAKEKAEAMTLQAVRLWSTEREKIVASFERLRAQAIATSEAKGLLQTHIVELEAQLKIKDAAVQELQREILTLETSRHALGVEVDRARGIAKEANAKAEEQRSHNEVLKAQRDALFTRAKEFEKAFEAEKNAARDHKAALELQVADARQRAELQVKESKLELEMQLRELKQQNDARARYIQRLESDSGELRNQLAQFGKSYQEARMTIDRQANDAVALTREIEEKALRIQALIDDVARAQAEAHSIEERARSKEMQFLEFSTRIASLEEKGRVEVSIKDQEIAALKKELTERDKDSKDRLRREEKEKNGLRGEIDRLKTVFPMRELVTEKRRQVDEVARDLGALNENHPEREAFVELLRKLEDQRDRLEGVLQAASSLKPSFQETIVAELMIPQKN
jgi:chromosome segregation ATPase